jgi:hypothetical protein
LLYTVFYREGGKMHADGFDALMMRMANLETTHQEKKTTVVGQIVFMAWCLLGEARDRLVGLATNYADRH